MRDSSSVRPRDAERDSPFAAHCTAIRCRLEAARRTTVGADSVSWTINREMLVVAGWGHAILLQFAHPLIAAAVAEHSSFRSGGFSSIRRLYSTVGAMLALTFGHEDAAIHAAAGINVIHDRVYGRLAKPAGAFPAGTPYSAHFSELLHWVHLTLLDSVPRTYELLVEPLDQSEKDRYCAEAAVMEPLLGITPGTLPRTAAEADSQLREILHDGTIVVSETARELARAVLWPRGSGLLWPIFRPLRLLSIGLLPHSVREGYGFGWSARDSRALRRWVRGLRLVRRLMPRALREWPASRRTRIQAQAAASIRQITH